MAAAPKQPLAVLVAAAGLQEPAVASVPLSEPVPMPEAGLLAVAAVAVPLAEPLLHLHLHPLLHIHVHPLLHLHLHLPILDLHLDLDLSLPFRLPFLLPLLLAQKQCFARPVCMPPPSLVLL